MQTADNAGLLSKISKEVATEIAKNVVVDNPTVIFTPLPEEPPGISDVPYISTN